MAATPQGKQHRRNAQQPGTINQQNKARLACLCKRRDFLKQRVAASQKDLSYDRAEMAALDWAINIVCDALGIACLK